MSPTKNEMLPESFDEELERSFEQVMLDRVRADYSDATDFMRPFHKLCVNRHEMYHNASNYESLRKKNRFPMTFFQEQVDVFTADVMDKLFYKNRPCTVTGVEDSDMEDAQVKQDLLDWQDYKDDIKVKIRKAIKDTALYGVCVSQVDFDKEYDKKIVGVDEPVFWKDDNGNLFLDGDGNPIPKTTIDNQIVTTRKAVVQEVPVYIGPRVKHIDPLDLFLTQDDDDVVMIRSFHPLKYFKSRPYFFNYKQLSEGYEDLGDGTVRSSGMIDTNLADKRKHRSFGYVEGRTKKNREYVEWQGMVNKRKLYEFLQKEVDDDQGQPLVTEDEETLAICGVANDRTVVRLEETPFDSQKPNVIIGLIQPEEDDKIGVSIADKIGPVQKGLDILMGITLANFKQSVNAGHVIDKTALVNSGDIIVNKEGFVLEVNGDVRAAHKRVEQPPLSQDLWRMMEYFKQMGYGASGIRMQTSGAADPGVDTLGEANLIDSHATLRIKDYLEALEQSFIQPLWSMRNQINMQFLKGPYLYGVVGEAAIKWRKATTTQIRANVDFVCESSVRETNKGIVTQQLLQFAQIAPLAVQMGFPVRLDKLLGKLAEQGFSWSTEQTEDILPSIKMEKKGIDIDTMLLQTLLVRLQTMGAVPGAGLGEGDNPQGGGGGGGGASPGTVSPQDSIPQPRSEKEATVSNQARNLTQMGRL